MAKVPGDRFMRLWIRRWLDDPAIRGTGDGRKGGITLAQEAVYLRLCLEQVWSADGYLPNRTGFLCDTVACTFVDTDVLLTPVLERFFDESEDGSKLSNKVARQEWEAAHKKSSQATASIKLRWKRHRAKNTNVSTNVSTNEDTELEREKSKTKQTSLIPTEEHPAVRYVDIYNAVYGTRKGTLEELKRKFEARLKLAGGPKHLWKLYVLPILARAQGRLNLVPGADSQPPDILLRDGSHSRTTKYGTSGATDWLMVVFNAAEKTTISAAEAELAERHDLLGKILMLGVKIEKGEE